MLSFIPIAAMLALASAVPHGHKHLRIHAPRIVAHDLTKAALLAGRDELPTDLLTGKCGGDTGLGCAAGYCCSEWGYCGVTPDYCGAGCQSGDCSGNSTAPAPTQAIPPPVVSVTVAPISSAETEGSGTSVLANKGHPIPASFFSHASTTLATQFSAAPTQAPYSIPEPSATEAPATTEAPAATSAAPPASAPPSTGGGGGGAGLGDSYTMYTGDGDVSSGWPSQSDWMSFDDMWEANLPLMSSSCAQWLVDNNSDEENANLKSAIQSVASSAGIDERFVLAIVMQESQGCVRAPTTKFSVTNPGLMQSHNGQGTCNPGTATSPQGVSPCPMSEITQMIQDGAAGTLAIADGGDGLEQTVQQAACEDVSKYYKGARIYNSGSIDASRDLGMGVATHCYASDVANRLTGWTTASHGCTLS